MIFGRKYEKNQNTVTFEGGQVVDKHMAFVFFIQICQHLKTWLWNTEENKARKKFTQN